MTLEKVLFTVLKATEKDIEIIEKARTKNASGWWSYFYATNSMVPRPVQPRLNGMNVDHIMGKNGGMMKGMPQ